MFVIFGKGEKEKRKQEENWAAITDTIPDWGQFTELELSGPVPQEHGFLRKPTDASRT